MPESIVHRTKLARLRDESVSDWVCVNGDVAYTSVVEWSELLPDWLCLQTVENFPTVDDSVQTNASKTNTVKLIWLSYCKTL